MFRYFQTGYDGLMDTLKRKAQQEEEKEDEESLISSSTWTSDSAGDLRKKFVLRKRSWGQKDSDVDIEPPSDEDNDQVVRVFIRFLAGVGLTQGFYLLLTYHSMWNPGFAAMWTSIVGFFIGTGMAFSKLVRCVVVLLLPSFCTGKGRTVIMAFCLMLVATGPIGNIAYNYRQMSRSLTCGDELAFNLTKGLRPLVHEGQNAILSTMDDTVDMIIEAVEKAEETYQDFAEKLTSLGDVVKKLNDFTRNMGDVCAQKLGAFLCVIPSFIAKQAKKMITDPVKDAIAEIKAEFEVDISYSHEFHFDVNYSKSTRNITSAIMREVNKNISWVTNSFEWIRFVMGFSTAFVVLKAIKYRHKYLTSNEFDNCYITNQFVNLDMKRRKQGKIAALPLRSSEMSTYVRPKSLWMSKPELKRFAKGFSFLTFNCFYAVAVLFVDYGFYKLLHKLSVSLSLREQTHGLLQTVIDKGTSSAAEIAGMAESDVAAEIVTLAIGGVGFITIIYRSIASALEKLASAEGYSFAIENCLPKPRSPDYSVYYLLIILYVILYIVCILEPYLLRIRRIIMASYHPKREKVRVLFMRSKILSKRGMGSGNGLMSSVLKKACLSVQQSKAEEDVSLFSRFTSRRGLIGWIARRITGRTKYRCDVCRLAGGSEHAKLFTRCKRFGCKGMYCIECFEDLHRICLICLMRQTSKRQKKVRRSKAGEEDEYEEEEEEEGYDEFAEELLDSSGISDSSATTSEEEGSDTDLKEDIQVKNALEEDSSDDDDEDVIYETERSRKYREKNDTSSPLLRDDDDDTSETE